jgi:hypothetical protein
MRRSVLLTILLVMTLLTGCQESKGNLFFIMFESPPNLFEKGLYADGVKVGEIVDAATTVNGVTRLAVVLNGDYRELMKDSTAFFVSGGRLTQVALAGYGNPVEPGAKLMGFNSRLGINWFKAKNLMTPTSRAAADRAEELFEAFEAGAEGQ